MMEMGDLFEYYCQHFAVVRADTPTLLDQVCRLRYQVYCIENQFEDANQHRNGREMDQHDATSAHILLLHRNSGTAVGTARIIMPQLAGIWRPLPVWHILAPEVREEFERLPLRRTAEVSRFTVPTLKLIASINSVLSSSLCNILPLVSYKKFYNFQLRKE